MEEFQLRHRKVTIVKNWSKENTPVCVRCKYSYMCGDFRLLKFMLGLGIRIRVRISIVHTFVMVKVRVRSQEILHVYV